MSSQTPVAIVGAGPYGLSIAAHLRGLRLPFRIFGSPMSMWLRNMPKGMLLKSEGFATNLSDPQGDFTLERYCAEHGLEYGRTGIPVALDTVCAYGLAFQQRFAPDVEDRTVIGVEPSSQGFALTLDDGERVAAGKVVVAVGLDHFRHVPGCLAHLPAEHLSHSADHRDPPRLAGRDVVVVGGGASAIDLAVLLHEAGARVQLLHRGPSLIVGSRPEPRPLLRRVRAPQNGIGAGWTSYLCAEMPGIFHRLPRCLRVRMADGLIPPAAGWAMGSRAAGAFPATLGSVPHRAELRQGRVHLQVLDGGGKETTLVGDHVVAATGYHPDLGRIGFLDPQIRERLATIGTMPRLSADFESSVPGLFFAGPVAMNSFGPVVRFIYGADFTARRVARAASRYSPSTER